MGKVMDKLIRTLIGGVVAPVLLLSFSVELLAVTADDFQAEPPVISDSAEPLILLGLSVDHELFKKAYTDYANLEGEELSLTDTTYRNDFTYYGYFDSAYCYTYNSSSDRFEPGSSAGSPYSCPAASNISTTANGWSGNFLNWATMTRMDVVRRVLYGGKRSTDSNSETILERAHLPKDTHAFAKVYSGAELENYTPYTNASYSNGISLCNVSDSSGVPWIRVAKGSWRQWAASESVQCQWDSKTTTPDPDYTSSGGDKLTELKARVSVCETGKDATTSEDCQEYSGGNIKPVGLLQKNGEDGDLRFGLITGSYKKNDEGGVLRKVISKIAANTDSSNDELSLTTGIFTGNAGIIKNLDALQIANYSFGSSKYSDCSTHSITVDTFLTSSNSGRQCRDWGNPVAEIYLEGLRYLAGEGAATSSFDSDDSSLISDLSRETSWDDPMDANEPCAECAFIMLSSGVNSFDGDDLSTASDLPDLSGASSIDAYTDRIGDNEAGGSFSSSYISGGTDEVCTSRSLSDLSDAIGICAELPALQGTYDIAGLAYYAKSTDLRNQTGFSGDQTVDTFAVELAESLPSFAAMVDGQEVSFIPACQANTNGSASNSSSGWQGCSLNDVEVESLTEVGGVVVKGKYLIYWEDSHWGNDYDLDIVQRLEFCVGTACDSPVAPNQITIESSTPYAAAGNALRLSYSISGTASSDGIVAPWALRPGGKNFDGLNAADATPAGVTSEATTFTSGSSSASSIERPLYLAAKYGGFNDLDGDGLPSSTSEWDVRDFSGNYALDANGDIVGDGIPDNYYQLSNPGLLVDALTTIFSGLKTSVTSSSAAAVVANTSSGEGAIFQSSYYPEFQASSTDSIQWAGMVHALFRDENGYFREDTDGDAVLDGYTVDYAVSFFYDNALEETRVQRFSSSNNGDTFTLVDTVSFEEFNAIWNARDQLAALSNVTTQRSYDALASTGRHILTGIDVDLNGSVDSDELLDFDNTTIDPSSTEYYRYFGLDSTNKSSVDNIVNFIRGEEGITGYRSRAVDYDDDGTEEVWRLGDFIHSAPTSVSLPRARYDARYSDDTYTAYRQQYAKRRQVIYVGGNDGMLHAFNAGFYDPATKTYATQSVGGSEVAHPLGSELWAYVPMATLPHLQWLTAPDYGHVYYVDGSPRIYDVNIFSDDTDHPNGWGTILVMGLRFGGGDFQLDPDSDDNGSDADSDDVTTRSSFLIFDITNPEVAPRLLAEVQRPEEALMSIAVTDRGDSYTSEPSVTVSGDGVGATAVANLAGTGSLLSFTVDDAGRGYSIGDAITIGGDGSSATAAVTAVGANGEILAVDIVNPGGGYSSATATASLNLTNAVLSASLGNGANSDKLKTLSVSSGGSGYQVGDVINFSGDGSGATATVASVGANGTITGVTIDSTGSGYSSIDVDSITRAASSTATITPVLGFAIDSVDVVTQGAGYSSATVTVGSSSGTTATATVSFTSATWGYTTSRPVVVKRREANVSGSFASPAENDWYLVFGSGPSGTDALTEAVSDDEAKLYFYDLRTLDFVGVQEFDSNSFVGDLSAVDWNDDYSDDAIYFGTVEDNSGTQSGELKRVTLNFDAIAGSSPITFLDTSEPVIESPRPEKDGYGNRWVYVGSGRFLVTGDNSTTNTQYYYGVIEPDPVSSVSTSDMVNVDNVQVFTADPNDFATVNSVRYCVAPCSGGGADFSVNGTTITDWNSLRTEILKTSGWYRTLDLSVTNTSAARQVGASNLVGTTLLFSEYAPSTEQCSPVGYSRINAIHYQTGTASPYAPVGLGASTYNSGTFVSTDTGINNALSLLGGDGQGDSDDAQGSGISVDDHGVLTDADVEGEPAPYGRQSWREVEINWDTGL